MLTNESARNDVPNESNLEMELTMQPQDQSLQSPEK